MTQATEDSAATPERTKAPEIKPKEHLPLWVTLWGWYGVVAIFGAYYLSSLNYLEQGKIYQFLNLSGALGLSVLCFKKRTWQPLALNLAWSAIAGFAIYKLLFDVAVAV
ncbi:MAG: hypothetical protein ACI8TQ_001716 [Planctomycetota bacterium]|jgi:hypothetical protein